MKFLAILAISSFSFYGTSVHAQSPEAYFSYCSFNNPDNETYVEAYFAIKASTLHFVESETGFQAGAEIIILIRQGENIVNFDKFDIASEVVVDKESTSFNLLGQRRIAIPQGAYTIEASVSDLNAENSLTHLPPVAMLIHFDENQLSFSDIQLLESYGEPVENSLFIRNGIEMVPFSINFYPTDRNSLSYYTEIYDPANLQTGQDLLVLHSIRVSGENKSSPNLQKYAKEKGQPVLPVLGKFELSDLPSGNYDLVIEVRDRQNNLLASKKKFFQRSNKLAVGDLKNIGLLDVTGTFVSNYNSIKLDYFLKSVKPIASEIENRAINDIVASSDSVLKQQFLFNFWHDRDLDNPELAWKAYLVHVQYTEENFRTMNRYGFESDRGRVHLQYGPPNERAESSFEASALPHEIWQYDMIPNKETNVIFVFLNSDLISNDYRLIHSSATGEIKDARWKVRIYENFQIDDNKDLEDKSTREHFGTKISDIYNK